MEKICLHVGLVQVSGSHCPKGRVGLGLVLFLCWFWAYTVVRQNVKGKKFSSQPETTDIRVTLGKKKKIKKQAQNKKESLLQITFLAFLAIKCVLWGSILCVMRLLPFLGL